MAEFERAARRYVFASDNRGKLLEVEKVLAEFAVTVTPQSEFGVEAPQEDGASFVENALLKARHAVAVTGLPAIADDSGLAVDALDGRPGVHSARYAGAGASDEQNIDKLLCDLQGIEDAERGAAFHCAAVLVPPHGKPLIGEGVWRGRILRVRAGAGGFGYDPVFLDPQLGLTAAQLTAQQKNARSHRGQAFWRLAERLRTVLSA